MTVIWWQQRCCSWQLFIWSWHTAALTSQNAGSSDVIWDMIVCSFSLRSGGMASHANTTITLIITCNISKEHTLNINCCEKLDVKRLYGQATTPIFNPLDGGSIFFQNFGRVQLQRDGTRWRTGGEVKGKLANGVGSQYPSQYLGTWCIQHYYRWCAHLGCQ